tara:strand:+ start:5128 stop:5856 length:729 start_codon:yes stop_codon:yes gene_type:complete
MPRLDLHRYIFAGLIFLLWLGPPSLAWLLASDSVAEFFPAVRARIDLAELPWREVNALVLVAGVMLPILVRPAPAGPLAPGSARNSQRAQAGLIDVAVVVLVFGRPIGALVAGLDPHYAGTEGLEAWLARSPSYFDGAWAVPAWIAYTAGHLMLRRQTVGQAVTGYWLVHPTPLGTWQEALYQTGRVIYYVGWDFVDPRRPWRGRHQQLTPAQFAEEETWQRKQPGWYASAGITTEVVKPEP